MTSPRITVTATFLAALWGCSGEESVNAGGRWTTSDEVPRPSPREPGGERAGEPEIYVPRIPYDWDWGGAGGGGDGEWRWGCPWCWEGSGGAGGGGEVPVPGGGSGPGGSGPGGCDPTVCFDVEVDKDISFLAVDADPCPGGDLEVSITKLGNGPPAPIDQPVTTVGQGQDCGGELSPGDLKVERIGVPHVEVCVTFVGSASPGSIEVWAKAGTECTLGGSAAGSCSPCERGY